MRKRFTSLICVFIMVFALVAGCGTTDDGGSPTTTPKPSGAPTVAPIETEKPEVDPDLLTDLVHTQLQFDMVSDSPALPLVTNLLQLLPGGF